MSRLAACCRSRPADRRPGRGRPFRGRPDRGAARRDRRTPRHALGGGSREDPRRPVEPELRRPCSIFFDAGALARLSREDAQRLEAMPTRVQDGRVVVAVAEPTEQRLQALREVIGEDTVMVVVPRAALDAALSSELLTSRTPASEREAPPAIMPPPAAKPKPAFEPLQIADDPPPPAYRDQDAEAPLPAPAAAARRERRPPVVPHRPGRLARPGLRRRGRGTPPPRAAARKRARAAERGCVRSAAAPAGRTPPPLFLIPRLGEAGRPRDVDDRLIRLMSATVPDTAASERGELVAASYRQLAEIYHDLLSREELDQVSSASSRPSAI